MARDNTRNDDDEDEVSYHRHFHWSLKDIPRFEGQDEQPFLHLMELEDYLVAGRGKYRTKGGKRQYSTARL